MITKQSPSFLRMVPAVLALLALVVTPMLHAGTPLICFPYEIGQARSLPGDPNGPKGTSARYNRTQLVSETLSLLTPGTPVIVRMETIRRAVVYATKGEFFAKSYPAEDQKLVTGLLAGLKARTQVKEEKVVTLALAYFDLGFLSETLRQAGVDSSLNGYKLLLQARELRGPDAGMEFALALASSWPKNENYAAHYAQARALETKGTLLTRNIESHLSGN